jgi:hypothetical protein
MADVVISEGDSSDLGTAEGSAHAAAVAEGATAVQAEQAQQAAEEAKAAAEMALSAAQANIESGLEVQAASAAAQDSAHVSAALADEIRGALQAQSAAIAALTEQFDKHRKALAPDKPSRSKPDREPGSGGQRLVRR